MNNRLQQPPVMQEQDLELLRLKASVYDMSHQVAALQKQIEATNRRITQLSQGQVVEKEV